MNERQLATLTFVAFLVGWLVRMLKTDRVDLFLAMFRVPPIPKPALPWIALLLGATTMVIDSVLAGGTWQQGALAAGAGLISGSVAVAGNETIPNAMFKLAPKTTNVVFGKASPTAELKTALDAALSSTRPAPELEIVVTPISATPPPKDAP